MSTTEVTNQSEPHVVNPKDDEKIPLFLIKLWNIVEDPVHYEVVRWDESGYSFHILEPYSFCRNVLPQYYKHNNLNSLIRQLNMYGFRKMTPIERTSLARAESDQDHLEFSHPCFVRDHPELLVNIKRKAPVSRQQPHDGTVNIPAKDLNSVFEELRNLRDRQKEMETKMSDLAKENEMVWQEMGHMRASHVKQQQIVTKLVQFMVALLQPSKRLGKRNILAIDEFQPKRARVGEESDFSLSSIQSHNVGEILDRLMREYSTTNQIHNPHLQAQISSRRNPNVPIISDVTDELDNSNITNTSTKYPIYESYPQQSRQQFQFMPQTNRNPNLPINTNLPNQLVSTKRTPQSSQLALNGPTNTQQSNMIQLAAPYPNETGEAIPVVSSPSEQQIPLINEDPIISSPVSGPVNFSPSEFDTYLSGMDHSINQCRDMIGDHWDNLNLDDLLNGYEGELAVSPPNQQEIRSRHIQSGAANQTENLNKNSSNNIPYTSRN